jgi:hypothetical protein
VGVGYTDPWISKATQRNTQANMPIRMTALVLNSHLCIFKDDQCKRFMAQLDESMKRWKF